MAELKTRKTNASVKSFLNSIADEQTLADCVTIAEIMEKATQAKPKMWGSSIVGFGSYHYVYASGREGDWMVTGFSPRKQALTIYIMAGFGQYDELLEKLGKVSTGKSCLYIKRLSDVHLPTLKKLISASARHMAATGTRHPSK